MAKFFIISLPRTGTTSLCLHFLDLGFKVAHNAFNPYVIEAADLVADTPIYIDYKRLHAQYPEAQFIYLERSQANWLSSIRRLLRSMRKHLINHPHAFEAEIIRCFQSAFPDFMDQHVFDDDYLLACYQAHLDAVNAYFSTREDRLLRLNIEAEDAVKTLHKFIKYRGDSHSLPHVNRGRRITYWEGIEHPNKIESTLQEKNRQQEQQSQQ